MGEAERANPDLGELMRMASNLSPERRAELVDFAAFLAARESRQDEASTEAERAWLDAVAADTADRIAALEDEQPAAELEAWHSAMAKAAKPARYVPGVGLVIEGVQ